MSNFEEVEEIEELHYFSPENKNYSFPEFFPAEQEENEKKPNTSLNDSIKIENILYDENNLKCQLINPYTPLNPSEIQNIITGKTEPSSKGFLKKKRNLKKKDKEILDHISIKEDKDEKKEKAEKEIEINEDNVNKKRGRRLKDKLYITQAEHDKFKEDNIIRKIKTSIFKYILDHLNNSLENTKYRFYPLDKDLNENLKKDFNVELLERTIYDIYDNSEINKRFKNPENTNKDLLKKIFEEKLEIRTIDILNKKYKDFLNHIREQDLENFLETIEEREKKKQEKNIGLYMEIIKRMLFGYENWFYNKFGRNTKIRETIE